MSGPIDEERAWELLLAAEGETRDGGAEHAHSSGGGSRAEASATGDVSLELMPDGTWSASGPCSESARALFDLYAPVVAQSDVVIGQLGQSLDGRIATESGASHYVTGPEDLDRLHRLRALVDAVIVGANTVEADDPRLTVRRVPGTNPVRVALDPNRRLDAQRRIFTDGEAETVVVEGGLASPGSVRSDADTIAVPLTAEGELDLHELVEALRARGLRRILVEGGGVTVSRFLAANLLDRLHVTVAPLLIGSGRPSLILDPVMDLSEALRPACRHVPLGRDVLFDLDLRAAT